MDADEGDDTDPLSLHKYPYAEIDPVDNTDPSGNDIDELIDSFSLSATVCTCGVRGSKFSRGVALTGSRHQTATISPAKRGPVQI